MPSSPSPISSNRSLPARGNLAASQSAAAPDAMRVTSTSWRALPSSPRYDRSRDLPRLVRIWPQEIASDDPLVRRHILRKLAAALRAERQRGLAGHWSYDVARHSQLAVAYRAELCDLHECPEVFASPPELPRAKADAPWSRQESEPNGAQRGSGSRALR